MELKVKRLHRDAIIPEYATTGAACFDLHALLVDEEDGSHDFFSLGGGAAQTFRTGLAFEVPEGWVMLIFSRSGHGFKSNVRLSNCVGVIDSDYRGEVMVKLTSDASVDYRFDVFHGDRIAQAMLVPARQVALVEVKDISDTERGAGGFGSTGK